MSVIDKQEGIDVYNLSFTYYLPSLPKQKYPFTKGPLTFAIHTVIPVALDLYFLIGMISETIADEISSKSAIVWLLCYSV